MRRLRRVAQEFFELSRRAGPLNKDAVEPALPGHTHRPLGGDAAGGAGGYSILSRWPASASFFGSVRVSTPFSYFAFDFSLSMSVASWKLRATAP